MKHRLHEFDASSGLTLVADICGAESNKPVVFAHGGGQTRHAWGRTGQHLAEKGFQSICVDLRGHGESDWCPEGDYRIETFANDLVCVCEEIGSPPAVAGASLGGISAMVAAGELRQGLFKAIVQ
ncbi:MAG: alpha/beta fold hydrolase [Pseudomonadales bacterium]